jgi:hypothetical protein
MSDETHAPITRDDIEEGFTQIVGELQGQVDDAKPKLLTAAVGIGILFVIAAYLAGRRVGTTKSTVVEIRRI